MKRVLLTLRFDGTDYHGWQVQENAVTVQQTLQDGLEKVLGTRPDVTGCSRTDAGVHANMFCCHLDCDDNFPKEGFLLGLNAVLPKDIGITAVREIPGDFHARYRCEGKNYIYRFYVSDVHDPFMERYALRLNRLPDISRMNDFCGRLVGTHDFVAFSSAGRSVTDTVRTIRDCNISQTENLLTLSVTGNGFLYNMVRIIAGTAREVGFNRLEPDCADRAFDSGDRNLLGATASPKGLFLNRVFYQF